MSEPKILFTSPWGPYPQSAVEDDPVDFFYYRNTLKQGLFQLRCFQSWHPLHFMAQNLPVRSTVLENPSPTDFKREMRRDNYQVVALTFTQLMLGKVMEMARWLKREYPDVELVLGGYGTSLFTEKFPLVEELRGLSDQICEGEGLAFFRTYLKERWEVDGPLRKLTQDLVPARNSLFRNRRLLFRQLVFVSGLGCVHGCDFCSTSHHFKKRHIKLFSGEELFKSIAAQAARHPEIQSAVIYDEDFLARRSNVEALINGLDRHPELRTRPLHPSPGTPLWDRLKNEHRLLDDYRIESDGIGDFNFVLKNFHGAEAQALVSRTYAGLVEEGGPWPFRLAENLLQGFLQLRGSDKPLYQHRAAAYGKMLQNMLPLALLSGSLFKGPAFQNRHRKFRQDMRRLSRPRYYQAWVVGWLLLPGLLLSSWWGKLIYNLSLYGDQPNKIRRRYPQ